MIEIDIRRRLLAATGPLTLAAKLRVDSGQFVTLFGKSGAGKTTLLRILAGLAAPDRGVVRVGGETWFDSERRINLPPQRRPIGFVFQDQALFPHLSVRGNLEYALPKGGSRGFIDDLLELTGLAALQHRRPDTLSGGQRQRVALARALARRPAILMLDEPLSALDTDTRLILQDEILRLHRALGVTTLMISHDLSEVFRLSDRVVVLEDGVITRQGPPAEVFGSRQNGNKMRLPAEVLKVNKDGILNAVTVLAGNQIFGLVADNADVDGLRAGDRVLLLPKTFSPMLVRMA